MEAPGADIIAAFAKMLQAMAEAAENNAHFDPEAAAAAAAADELTEELLAAVRPAQCKQLLGERLFPKVKEIQPDLAGKLTGMMLEMGTPEILLITKDPLLLLVKVQEGTEVLLQHCQTVLPTTGTTVIRRGAVVRAPVHNLDAYMPPASRPLLTARQLAAVPAPERRLLMEHRLFYAVHKLQPLMSKRIAQTLVTAAESNPTERGWRQEGSRWVNAPAMATASRVLAMLDQPAELARLVNTSVEALRLRSMRLPAGLSLRSDEEVLAAAAGLAPEGQALPWAPLPGVHPRFPPAFRSAARALLLCRARARRMVAAAEAAGGGTTSRVPQGVGLLDSLPEELIQPILALAAHPLEAWS
ncbi:hypothetical protein ABPG75_011106 [Micractinium tetrahymenae]